MVAAEPKWIEEAGKKKRHQNGLCAVGKAKPKPKVQGAMPTPEQAFVLQASACVWAAAESQLELQASEEQSGPTARRLDDQPPRTSHPVIIWGLCPGYAREESQ